MRIKLTLRIFYLLILVACQATPEQSTKTQESFNKATQKIIIAWIPKGLNNPVFEVGRVGAIQKAAELSAAADLKAKLPPERQRDGSLV